MYVVWVLFCFSNSLFVFISHRSREEFDALNEINIKNTFTFLALVTLADDRFYFCTHFYKTKTTNKSSGNNRISISDDLNNNNR